MGINANLNRQIQLLKYEINEAEALVIGAGAGLSTAAGYTYTGERFEKYFSDFKEKYGIKDMYSGGFYPFSTYEEFWGFWCRYIWINRYSNIPTDLYERLFDIVKSKNYFIITTNVDHCFQRSGFNKNRLFYTQGDYGLFQSLDPAGKTAHKTYDNFKFIKEMVISEGYEIKENGDLCPKEGNVKMKIPSDLIPRCPDDGSLMTVNLRSDDKFVEDYGWRKAQERYEKFLNSYSKARVLYLELGVGMNTPGIVKFRFIKETIKNKNAVYACINKGEAYTAEQIAGRSIVIDADISDVIRKM